MGHKMNICMQTGKKRKTYTHTPKQKPHKTAKKRWKSVFVRKEKVCFVFDMHSQFEIVVLDLLKRTEYYYSNNSQQQSLSHFAHIRHI